LEPYFGHPGQRQAIGFRRTSGKRGAARRGHRRFQLAQRVFDPLDFYPTGQLQRRLGKPSPSIAGAKQSLRRGAARLAEFQMLSETINVLRLAAVFDYLPQVLAAWA
jgi:hypothetical protein